LGEAENAARGRRPLPRRRSLLLQGRLQPGGVDRARRGCRRGPQRPAHPRAAPPLRLRLVHRLRRGLRPLPSARLPVPLWRRGSA
jgi:hypothetical protein